jgi:hypothetical protein
VISGAFAAAPAAALVAGWPLPERIDARDLVPRRRRDAQGQPAARQGQGDELSAGAIHALPGAAGHGKLEEGRRAGAAYASRPGRSSSARTPRAMAQAKL